MDNIELAFSEVYEIINLMSYDLRKKIPSKFINLIETQRDEKCKSQIERGIPLEQQNLREETIGILEKKQCMKWLNENEKKFQKEMNEKYNSQDIFKKDKAEIIKNEMQLMKKKETILKKIKKIIFKLLHIEEK